MRRLESEGIFLLYTLFILFIIALTVNSIAHVPLHSSQVQNRHQNRPSIASDEIRHNKSPRVYLQHACITLSAVLRFSSSGDMSYGTLSETTL